MHLISLGISHRGVEDGLLLALKRYHKFRHSGHEQCNHPVVYNAGSRRAGRTPAFSMRWRQVAEYIPLLARGG